MTVRHFAEALLTFQLTSSSSLYSSSSSLEGGKKGGGGEEWWRGERGKYSKSGGKAVHSKTQHDLNNRV